MKAALIATIALSSFGSAFVVETFTAPDCLGEVLEEVNVYDNTCARWPEGFWSIKPKYYGGGKQFGTVYGAVWENVYCDSFNTWKQEFWADGSDDFFQKGNCIDLGFRAKAMGSRILL